MDTAYTKITAGERSSAWRFVWLGLAFVSLAGGFIYWGTRPPPRKPVVMRDMKNGVRFQRGPSEDQPELIVDPFPEEPVIAPQNPLPPAPVAAPPKDEDVKRIVPQLGWERPRQNTFQVDHNGLIAHPEQLGRYLQGAQQKALNVPPTFMLNAIDTCRFSFKVDSVNDWTDTRLELAIDGKHGMKFDIQCAKNNPSNTEAVYAFDIPPGKHRVTLKNVGADWVCIAWYKFEGKLED